MPGKTALKEQHSLKFRALLAKAGWSKADAARVLNTSRANITHWANGKTDCGQHILELLESKVDASREQGRYPLKEEVVIVGDVSRAMKPGKGPYWGQSDEVPVVSEVSAGDAHSWEDRGHVAPRIKVNCSDENCYAVEVWGDSMEKDYHKGDILVIAPNLRAQPGDLVVFKTIEGEPYFKLFKEVANDKKRGKILRFLSLNDKYPIKEIPASEIGPLHVVHHVIAPKRGKLF